MPTVLWQRAGSQASCPPDHPAMTTVADIDLTATAGQPAPDPALVHPHVIVLFGATGDLARRKLLPGLLRLSYSGLLPECQIVGTSLEELDDFRVPRLRPRGLREVRPGRHRGGRTGRPSETGCDTSPRAVGRQDWQRPSNGPSDSSAVTPGGSTT